MTLQVLQIGGIGAPEMAIILLIAVLLFGANKIPKLARSTGQALGEFQKGREEIEQELQEVKETASLDMSGTADGSTGGGGRGSGDRAGGGEGARAGGPEASRDEPAAETASDTGDETSDETATEEST